MSQQFVLTLTIKDAVTLLPIPVCTVTDTAGNNQTTSTGVFTQSYPYSAVTVYVTSQGYASQAASYIMDSNKAATMYLTKATSNTQNTWWTPHTVQITLMDNYGQRLPDVSISANYNQSAMPVQWVAELYGIQSTPAADMVNSAISLNGTTGSDGTLTTTMLGSLKYDILLNSATYGLTNYHVSAYPSDPMLNIYVATTASALITNASNSLYTALNGTRVYFTEPDLYNVTMCINYQDNNGLTTSVNETWQYSNNNTVIFNQVLSNPGTTANLSCYTMPNVKGTQVWWGYNSSRSV